MRLYFRGYVYFIVWVESIVLEAEMFPIVGLTSLPDILCSLSRKFEITT